MTGSAGFGTAGVLSGNVELAGDSAIEFASGEITSLAADAQLRLNGNDAFIEDSTALGSNSALTGLASIGAGATFDLENEASVSTTGALANDGTVDLDANPGDGGSSLTVAGALTNSGSLIIGISPYDALGVGRGDGGVARQYGLDRSHGLQRQPGAPRRDRGQRGIRRGGSLERQCGLAGDSAIEFASGQITTIAAGSAIEPHRKRRLHRGQHGARLEQRSDRARFNVAGSLDLSKRGLGVDDRGARPTAALSMLRCLRDAADRACRSPAR